MLQTRKIGKGLVAVSFGPTEILVRKSGKAYFGQEKCIASVEDGVFKVDIDAARELGLATYVTYTQTESKT